MKPAKESVVAFSLLAAVLVANAIGLAPELTISRFDLNDNAMHFPLVAGLVQAIERGENPFDWWAPEWSLGYPVLRTYQPLAHSIVAAAYFALFKSVSLMTVFVWVRYFSVALLPLTFFITARLLSLSPLTAASAAMLAPLISTPALYGLEYGSYLWAGSGLFTQAVACHFALLSIGFAYGAIRQGRRLALTGILLGLTFLSHFIYGYIAALTACLLAVMPDSETPRAIRIGRAAWLGAIALALSAFELVPLMLDRAIINHSRWEYAWKWDSFGSGQVLKWLFSGELLDHGRLPVLTLLAMAGAGFVFRDLWRDRSKYPERTFIALGSVLWILMFFGRPFWGPALVLLGVSPDMQLHRVIGGVHIFLVFLAAIALAAIWQEVSKRSHVGVAVLATILLFFPMVRERAKYLSNNKEWGTRSLAAYNANRDATDRALAIIKDRGGRAYAGLAASWGGSFKIGDLPFYAYISREQGPALSFLYHSMSLPSEIMTRFNEWSSAHYRLFDIRTVVAPASVDLPSFLTPVEQAGSFRILAAPGGGDFDLVDVLYAIRTTKYDFYDINDRWLQSPWVANRQHLFLDFFGDAPAQLARLSPSEPLPASVRIPYPGEVLAEQRDGQIYRAEIEAARPSYVLFKTTWHPNWTALVDGEPVRTAMLSPGFVGIPVSAGRHSIQCRYRPESWQWMLAVAGVCFALLAFLVCEAGRTGHPASGGSSSRNQMGPKAGGSSQRAAHPARAAREPAAVYVASFRRSRRDRISSPANRISRGYFARKSLAALGARPEPGSRPAVFPLQSADVLRSRRAVEAARIRLRDGHQPGLRHDRPRVGRGDVSARPSLFRRRRRMARRRSVPLRALFRRRSLCPVCARGVRRAPVLCVVAVRIRCVRETRQPPVFADRRGGVCRSHAQPQSCRAVVQLRCWLAFIVFTSKSWKILRHQAYG